jgi:hypothetical protein
MSRSSAVGLLLATLALVASMALHLAGPFDPVAPEEAVADRAASFLDSARALWRGETPPPPAKPRWTADRGLELAAVVLSALALAFSALALARGEAPRVVLALAALAAGALGFSQPLAAPAVLGAASAVLVLERLLRPETGH